MRPALLGRVRLCATWHIKKNLLCYSDFVSFADETCTLRQSETLCHVPHYFFYFYLLCYSDFVNLADETFTLRQSETMSRATFTSSVIAILLTLQMRPSPIGKVRLCATCHICLLCYSDSINLADDLCSSNQCQNGGECVLLPMAMAGVFPLRVSWWLLWHSLWTG